MSDYLMARFYRKTQGPYIATGRTGVNQIYFQYKNDFLNKTFHQLLVICHLRRHQQQHSKED